MSSEPTKYGREAAYLRREIRKPWAVVARRAGRLHVRMCRAEGRSEFLVAAALYVECIRTARMLAEVAAHVPVPEAWVRE